MKRRDFLNKSAFSLTAMCGLQMFGLGARFSHAAVDRSKKLFIVFLRGGFDGLSAMPSVANIGTIRLRRRTMHDDALYTSFTEASGYRSRFLIHNSLSALNGSQIAIFPHAGSLNSTKSHFEQMNYIESGDPVRILSTGYLGRALALESDLRSAAVGSIAPMALRGADPLVISSARNISSVLEVRNPVTLIRPAYSGPNGGLEKRLKFLGAKASLGDCGSSKVCSLSHEAANSLSQLDLNVTTESAFELAAVISASPYSPQIITLDVEGWDIHNDGRLRMVTQLSALNSGLLQLKQGLIARGLWNDSAIVVMSEFGRTIDMNGAGGLDHGRGGLMFVMGGRIRPPANANFANDWGFDSASLAEEGPSQCFKVKTDYRDVLAHLMIDHLKFPQAAVTGAESEAVFANHVAYKNPQILS